MGDTRLMYGGRVPQEVGRENARLLRKEVPGSDSKKANVAGEW